MSKEVYEWLLKGDYEQALSGALVEAAEPQNGMLIGGPLDAGIALLLLGRLEEAKQQLRTLIKQATYRMSPHRIYLGLVYWDEGDDEQAIATWREALRNQYARDGGLDVHYILAHASAWRPDLISRESVTKGIEQHLAKKTVGFCCRLAEYLVGRRTEEDLIERASEVTGHYVAQITRSNLAMAEFGISTKRLIDGDIEGCRHHLKNCASVVDCPNPLFEIYCSRLEYKHIRRRVSRYRRAVSS